MDFSTGSKAESFREEVRQFIKENPIKKFPCQAEDDMWGFGGWSYDFTKKLGEAGWLSLTWPKKWGGMERTMMEKVVMIEELAYHMAPCAAHLMGDGMAKEIIEYGSDKLKKELLPKLAKGTATFWLAFSEPGAGSDLLSLTTRADEKKDHFVVNGQKTWSSYAHLADYGYLIARTDEDVPKHKGLSMLIVDKKLPGISITPIISLAGHHLHNEVFFDNVKISKAFLLGKKNEGFYQMLKGLEADRFWARLPKAAVCNRILDDLVEYSKSNYKNGVSLCTDSRNRQKLAQIKIEVEACKLLFYRIAWMLDQNIPVNYESVMGKIFADELGQRLVDIGMEMFGLSCQLEDNSKWAPFDGALERWYLISRGHTIAGGPTETMKDTIARMGLRLPKA
jgi:alkylation response protein AidB-like acyl-CoA dehydrogenase